MKSQTKSKKLSVISLILFMLVLAVFGMQAFPQKVRAADSSTINILKFRQVEVGQDFAIGLTYDGDLYGWSLGDTSTGSLGAYYNVTYPKKINVTFYEDDASSATYLIAGKTTTDSILKIATTKTTAAFITEKGYVYTWGKEEAGEAYHNILADKVQTVEKGLLFRSARYNLSTAEKVVGGISYKYGIANVNTLVPQPIMHHGYSVIDNNGTELVKRDYPESGSPNATDIFGSDNNYVIALGANKFFAWGNSYFGQLRSNNNNIDYSSFPKEDGSNLKIFDGQGVGTPTNNPINFSAIIPGSDYLVGVNGDDLYLKGKNYYLPSTMSTEITVEDDGSDDSGKAQYKTTLPSMANITGAKDGYMIYDSNGDSIPANFSNLKIENAVTLEFESITDIGTLSDGTATKFKTSDGNVATFSDKAGTELASEIISKNIALGNGFMYYIDDTGTVYFLGNNYEGQGGSNLTAGDINNATTGISDAAQVVAGKIAAPTISQKNTNDVGGDDFDVSLSALEYNSLANDTWKINYASGKKNITAVIKNSSGTYTANSLFTDSATERGMKYISAALTTSGGVKAWGNSTTTVGAIKDVDFGIHNPTIVKLSAGYGNNLFALDSYGKIYHIKYNTVSSKYEGKLIDTFCDEGGKTISNWTVGTSAVTIASGYNTSKTNNKFEVRPAYSYSGTETSDTKAALAGASGITDQLKSTGKLITSKYSGDAFRIMYHGIVGSTNFTDKVGANNAGVEFWLGDAKMTDAAVEKFILWDVKYNSALKDLYFEIQPLRSTMGEPITMKFHVGRFDSVENYVNPSFYDSKPVSYNITIENTNISADANIKLNAYLADGSKNSTIPLLDPNNPYNSSYSISVMNVSDGFNKIVSELDSYSSLSDAEIKSELFGLISKKDIGFPAFERINSGNLSYTLGADASIYYNSDSSYQYIATDIDGSLIKISGLTVTDAFSNLYEVNTIDISFDLTNILNPANITDFQSFIGSGDNKDFLQRFDNTYGFYDMSFDKVGDGAEAKYILKFKYDVITVTAKNSTNSVAYTSNNISQPVYNSGREAAGGSFRFQLTEQGVSNTIGPISLSVHAQSTLRITKTDRINKVDVDKGIDGNSGNNIVVAKTIATSIGAGETTIKLSEFFTDTTNIYFAYEGKRGESAFSAFKGTFNEQVFAISMTDTSFTFMPKSSVKGGNETFNFAIEVRRFADLAHTEGEDTLFSSDAEVIYIYFNVECTHTQFEHKTTTTQVYYLSKNPTVNLRDRINAGNSWNYIEVVGFEVSGAQSGTDRIVTVKIIDNHTLEFTPIRSGEVQVRYFLRRFNELLEGSFTMVVESIAQIGSYEIASVHDFYVNDIKNSLKAANASSDFKNFDDLIIDRDDEDAPNGIYFQVLENNEWKLLNADSENFPGWIESYGFPPLSGDKYFRIELGNVNSASQAQTIRVILKFKSDDGTKRFEAAMGITPAHKIIQDPDNNNEYLVFTIDYGKRYENEGIDPKAPSLLENNGVMIPMQYFVKKLFGDDSNQLTNVTLSFINPADSYMNNGKKTIGYQKYFEVASADTGTGSALLVIPLYPTKELENDRVQISLSVSGTNPDKTVSNYIFTFYLRITGISIDLAKDEYTKIFIITMISLFVLMFIVFIIRMSVFWKRKAKQRSIIRKNQTLIKLRDKMHQKNSTVSKERMVRTKMKMDDPKYAKMFNEMREKKEQETGISLDNSAIAQKADKKAKGADKAKSKKKGGKKSIDELKAELEAKKMAFAQMQGGVPPVMNMDSMMGGMEMDQSIIDSNPVFNNEYHGDLSREDVESQIKAKLAEEDFLEFETIEPDDNIII